jgi:DNA (cytosine-5)-methyltransferase 1
VKYERMTMEEVRAVPLNGLVAVGSFSGCGGSSTGLKMAGYSIPYVIEFVDAAADTYEANWPETFVDRRDIRVIQPEEILEKIGLERGELDLYEGSPPCASFSAAGMRERGWGTEKKYSDVRQQTDDLFDHYVRMVEGLRPRAFIAENVPGMEMGDAKAYMHKAGLGFRELGYRVDARVVSAVGFGVPQDRRRLIFIGVREDEGPEPVVPVTSTDARPVLRDALESVDPDDPDHAPFLAGSSMEKYAVGRSWHAARDGGTAREVCARCGGFLGQHEAREEFVGAVKKQAPGEAPDGLFAMEPEGGRRREYFVCADGERAVEVKDYFLLVVPDAGKPSPTITATGAQAGAASVTHPTECRKFTPAECKAISGFPSDYVLTGTREQRYERIGRAVVPPMYKAMGEYVAGLLPSRTAWQCSACGGTVDRYDGGDACEACVTAAFAEGG